MSVRFMCKRRRAAKAAVADVRHRLCSAGVVKTSGVCGAEGATLSPAAYLSRRSPICDDIGLIHNANTYSTTALRCSRSSGVLTSLALAGGLGPETIAIYFLPLTSKVIGGAEKPEPTLIFHN